LNIFSTLLSNKFQRQIPIHWKLTSHSSFNVHFLEFSQRDFSKRCHAIGLEIRREKV
jgi:hypothetical protein